MSSQQYVQQTSDGLLGDGERTAIHQGHVSSGSQLVSEGQQFTGVDMAAETAKFDNAFGAVKGHQEFSGSNTGSSGEHSSGLTGEHSSHTSHHTSGHTGDHSSGLTGEHSSGLHGTGSSSTGAYQGQTEHQHSTHGSSHHHHGTSGSDSYTGSKEQQREQMKEEKKENAQEKKDELAHRNERGESKSSIAKDEYNKASHQADKETPDGHKPSLMEKVKTAVKNL
ncbi:protein of unknown function [Taphrina deformans PYCC 5710]|uniref:Uncharacterized protein n=1 Tax=Taphrina deformans (strain PYCC 5710 / ATCC 11124 / CBS 356.35 / IMI 108563 / JCM 9778 / NBRC 8474) TaxID=1097556 RepID=R4XES3_TAPDE|nr:protein of unknown function [Taphrina deformans PYCC 5710]|eukprot:CCG84281.1 protein of unknown function [Taphrina deformans PYCC 5710]